MNLKDISEEELMEIIKTIFSLAKTLKIWEIRKFYALTSLDLKLKPLVQGLDSQSTEDKARHILEALSLIGTHIETLIGRNLMNCSIMFLRLHNTKENKY